MIYYFCYEYSVSDQGGNNVLAFFDLNFDNVANTSEAIQQTHYYPFGMQMYGLGTTQTGPENKYKMAGKELQDEFNLQQYDFGARYYDPAIARWSSPDPMTDLAQELTPFRYGFNNPMTYSDPSGMMETSWDGQESESATTGTITPTLGGYFKTGLDGMLIKTGPDASKGSSINPDKGPLFIPPVTVTNLNIGPVDSPEIASSGVITTVGMGGMEAEDNNENTADNHTNEMDVDPASLVSMGNGSNGGDGNFNLPNQLNATAIPLTWGVTNEVPVVGWIVNYSIGYGIGMNIESFSDGIAKFGIFLGIPATYFYGPYYDSFASEHTKNKQKKNWDKHTKKRSGRANTKQRDPDKGWKPNPNKKK